jgi:hypothetical protein
MGGIQRITISSIHSTCILSIRRYEIFLRHSVIVAPLLSLNGTLGMSSFCRLLLNSDLLFLIYFRNDACNSGVKPGPWYVIQLPLQISPPVAIVARSQTDVSVSICTLSLTWCLSSSPGISRLRSIVADRFSYSF